MGIERMRRKPWIVAAVIVLLLIGVHFAYWQYLETRLDAGFAAWVQARRAAGWTVSTGAERRHGWPLRATLSVADITLRGGTSDLPGGLDWHSPLLDLRIDLLAPGLLDLRARGTQRLRLGTLPALAITAARITGQMALTGDPDSPAGSLTASDLRARPAAATPATAATATATATATAGDRETATIGLLQIIASSDATAAAGRAAITWRIATEAIGLPSDRAWALGSRISSLSIEGTLDGPLPPPGSLLARATAWRDGGSKIKLRDMALGWGPLGASATGTLALDQRLQPVGSGQVRLVGYATALDALAAGHVVAPGAAVAAKAVLSLLAGPSQQGEPEAATIPLSLRDRTLAMRGMPLTRVPELIWPEP
jgi:hypothetical protein